MDKSFNFKNIREGRIVKGKVIRKSEGDIFVDIDYKSEGIISKEETSRYGYYETLKDGDEIDVFIKKIENEEGMVTLSKVIADKKVIFSRVKKAFKDGSYVEGTAIKTVKGGFIVDFGSNVTAFLPMSHAKTFGDEIEGKTMNLKVIQLDEEKRNVVVSYKEYAEEKNKKESEELLKAFPVSEVITVTVIETESNGVKVTAEGKEAFIPANELSWKPVKDLAKEFASGAELKAMVCAVEGSSPLLSVKRLKENPFKSFSEKFKPGDKLQVKVSAVIPEGVVMNIDDDLEGFVPVSEISYFRRIKDTTGIYNEGDELETQLIRVDEEKNRIYLSIKRLEKNPWPNMEERYPPEARVHGTISEIKEGEGVAVEIEENLEAFVELSDISWYDFEKISDVVEVGDKKEFKILGIDKEKYRILLGIKQLTPSPWSVFAGKYKEGAMVDVKVIDIEDAYVVCEIIPGVQGKIPVRNKSKVKSKKGDTVKARINKIDKDGRKVSLSAKDIEITEEKKQLDEYMKSHEHSFKMNDLINFGEDKKGDKK